MKKTRPHKLSQSPDPSAAFLEGAFVGEPQVPTTFERSAPAGSSSLAIPGSGVGLPGCEIPLELSCEREKGARLPAQPSGVARELISPAGGGRPNGICRYPLRG